MKKTTFFIQTNKGIKTINDSNEKHGIIVIHRPQYTQDQFWIISVLGYQITTAKKIKEARKIAKFLMKYSYTDENSSNYYLDHEPEISNYISSLN